MKPEKIMVWCSFYYREKSYDVGNTKKVTMYRKLKSQCQLLLGNNVQGSNFQTDILAFCHFLKKMPREISTQMLYIISLYLSKKGQTELSKYLLLYHCSVKHMWVLSKVVKKDMLTIHVVRGLATKTSSCWYVHNFFYNHNWTLMLTYSGDSLFHAQI